MRKDLDRTHPDPTTKLAGRTNYGRPRWDLLLPRIAEEQKNKSVGVFFCGPKPLGDTVKKHCRRINRDNLGNKTEFSFYAEKFY